MAGFPKRTLAIHPVQIILTATHDTRWGSVRQAVNRARQEAGRICQLPVHRNPKVEIRNPKEIRSP